MQQLSFLICSYCNTPFFNISLSDIKKLEGTHLICEYCGHANKLINEKIQKSDEKKLCVKIYSFETLLNT